MKALTVLAIVLLTLFLIGQIRVGGRVEYAASGIAAWVRIGRLQIQVFPLQKKEEKKSKPAKKPKPPKGTDEPQPSTMEKVGGALEYAKTLLPIALEMAGRFYQKLQMDTLCLELTAGSDDPADAAMLYGQASAALGAFWYPLIQAFHVKDGSAKIHLDFDAHGMTLYANAALSLKIGQILWIGIYFGLRAFMAFLAVRKQQKELRKQRKAV